MTLLIVDDEWYAVKGLSQGIDWAENGVDTVLEAFSAQEALQILAQQPVDVMICDIEMPEINGLDLSRRCIEQYPDIKIIFLTGHANFDYANEAIRMHAFDYVLKPVDHQRLAELVRCALLRTSEDKEQRENASQWKAYQEKLDAQRPERLRLFWRNVIDNRLNRESIHAWLSSQEIEIPSAITPVAVWMDEGDGTTREEDILAFVLDEKLDELVLSHFPGCRLRDPSLERLLLFYGAPGGLSDKLAPVLKSIERQLNRRLHWQAGTPTPPESLWWEIYQLRAETTRQLPPSKAPDSLDWENAIISLPPEQLHIQVDRAFAALFAQKDSVRLAAEKMRLQGAMLLLADRYAFSPRTVGLIQSIPDLQSAPAEALRQFHSALDLCIQEINACPSSNNALIRQVRQYIRTHLNQELTREAIATSIYVHPAYLSRLFKMEMGLTLSDYITEERIRKACRLLEAPDIKIGSIAAQVGISPFSYFCRVFRRITGMSPQEYRQAVSSAPPGARPSLPFADVGFRDHDC